MLNKVIFMSACITSKLMNVVCFLSHLNMIVFIFGLKFISPRANSSHEEIHGDLIYVARVSSFFFENYFSHGLLTFDYKKM